MNLDHYVEFMKLEKLRRLKPIDTVLVQLEHSLNSSGNSFELYVMVSFNYSIWSSVGSSITDY